MANNEIFTTTIKLNSEEAKNKLEELKKKVDDLKAKRQEAAKAGDDDAFSSWGKSLKKAESELRLFKQETMSIKDTLENIGSANIGQIEKAMRSLNRQLKTASDPEEVQRLQTQLQQCRNRIDEITGAHNRATTAAERYNEELKKAGSEAMAVHNNTELINRTLNNLKDSSVRDLEFAFRAVNEELRGVKRGTSEWTQLNNQLKQCKSALRDVREESKESTGFLSRTANFLNKNWGAITQVFALASGATFTMRKATEEYAKMEENMADVRKYTGLSTEAIRELNAEFKRMDTRTTRDELNELAGAAGRLGITTKEGAKDFVEGADIINGALGDDLGDGAVDKIGKLAMAFGEDDRLGLRSAMLATGSAINELAQNSSANAGYLVDFTARLSGVGKQAGLTQAQIMAFGAVMDENMQRDEMASTALSQLIGKMVTDTKTFAQMAGKDVKEFSSLVKNDMNVALMQFFEAMNHKGGFTELAPLFADMGLDGARATQVLSVLADKIDDVQKHQKLANDAYREGKSVVNEYNLMNNTVQAQLDKAKKKFNELTIELGEKLLPVARYGITTAGMAVRVMLTLMEFVTAHAKELSVLTVAIGILTATYNAHIIVMKLKNAQQTIEMALDKATVAAKNMLTFTVSLLSMAYYKLTGNMVKARAASIAMHRAAIANPYTALLAAIMAVSAAIYYVIKAHNDHKKAMHDSLVEVRASNAARKDMNDISKQVNSSTAEEIARINRLTGVIRSNAWTVGQRRAAIAELQKIVPDYHASITNEGKLIESNKDKLTKYINELRKAALAQAYMKKLTEIEEDRLNARMNADAKSNNVRAVNAELERGKDTTYKSQKQNVINTVDPSDRTQIETNKKRLAKLEELRVQKEAETNAIKELAVQDKRMNNILAQMKKDGIVDDRTKLKPGNGEDNGGVGGSTGTKTDKQLEKEEKARKKAEAESLKRKRETAAAAKAETNEELAVLAAQYAEGNKTYLQYLDERLEVQQRGLEKQKKIWGEESNEYKMLLDDEQKNKEQHDTAMRKLTEKEIERERRKKAALIEVQYYDSNDALYMNNDALNEALFQNDMEAMQKRLDLLKKGTEEWLNLRVEMEEVSEEHRFELEQQQMERLQQYREQAGRMDYDKLRDVEIEGARTFYQAMVKDGKMTQEELNAIIEHIKKKYAEMKAAQTENTSVKAGASSALDTAKKQAGVGEQVRANDAATGMFSIFQAVEQQKIVNEKLKEMYGEDYANNKEYQEAKRQLDIETMQNIVSGAQAAYSTISTFMSGASAYAKACSDLEVAQITKNYDKQIAAAGKNKKQVEKLEKERDKKIAEAKTKANKKAMNMEIAQAIAQTAMGAISAYSSTMAGAPYPANLILAPISAGIALAAGALQIATIKKQHQAQEAGYYEGGFTGGSNYRRRAGVVHEGEFVANHQAVNNTSILPALQLIDMAQRNNTVGSLTAADVSRAVGGGSGSAAVVAPVVNVTTDNEELRSTISSLNEVIDSLNIQLTEGIRAEVSIDGRDGIAEKLNYYNRLKNRK